MSGRKKDSGFILRRLLPGKAGCKAKCMFEVFHFRMQYVKLPNPMFNGKQVFNSVALVLFKNQNNLI